MKPQDAIGLLSGLYWDGSGVTYAFPSLPTDFDDAYSDINEPQTDFAALDTLAQQVFDAAFAVYAEVAGITITRAVNAADADILIGGTSAASPAYAYLPGEGSADGDIWLDLGNVLLDPLSGTDPLLGGYIWHLVLHEVGHALGLKHGHVAEFDHPALTLDVDGMENTVMTYRSYVGDPVAGAYTNGAWSFAQSLMVLDIAALQQIYGANYQTAAGDTTYAVDPETGEVTRDGVSLGEAGANVVFRTLWDGGGHDHLDLSNYTRAVQIDLAPGAGVDLDLVGDEQAATLTAGIRPEYDLRLSMLHNNDPRALIEEASGGSGDDVLIGHNGDNVLRGGMGADTLTGRLGADLFTGHLAEFAGDRITDFAATDSLFVDQLMLAPQDLALVRFGSDALLFLAQGVTLTLADLSDDMALSVIGAGEAGITIRPDAIGDIVMGDGGQRYVATGTSDLFVWGGSGADAIQLGAGNDIVEGGAGADVISGGAGDDTLIGGAGADALQGGAGRDVFVFAAGTEQGGLTVDTIRDFEAGYDILSLTGFSFDAPLELTLTPTGALLALSVDWYIQFVGALPDLANDVTAAGATIGRLGPEMATRLTEDNDRLVLSGTANQHVQSLGGDDAVSTGAGQDTLDGGAGADVLTGAGGADLLIGGRGSDVMTGGADADEFRFDLSIPETAFTLDQITDFDLAQDYITLQGTTAPIDMGLTPFGDGLLLELTSQHFVLFQSLDGLSALPDHILTYI